MTLSNFNSDSQGRLTLPPIHTLNLPSLSRPKNTHVQYQNHDNLKPSSPNAHHHDRQISTSSSHTSASRTVSLSPLPFPSDTDSEMNHSTSHAGTKFRLVPCPLEMADAVILVPPPDAYPTSNPPNYVPRTGHAQGLLLVGPAVHHVRQPQRQLAKGARIHPYRVVRGENTQKPRRSSIISITSFSHVA